MGYYAKSLPGCKKRPWKLQIVEGSGKNRKILDVLDTQLGDHQFSRAMTLEEAQTRASELNRDKERLRIASLKMRIKSQTEAKRIELANAIPDEAEFLDWLKKHARFASIKSSRFESHWLCTKKMVVEAKLGKATEWADRKQLVYQWFAQKSRSISYVQKVVRLANLYIKFYARTYKIQVEPIPYPRDYDRDDIDKAYFQKNPDGKTAQELTPAKLAQAESNMLPEHFNWLFISLWCGLRPSEIDALLTTPNNHRFELLDGTEILCVYQPKLKVAPARKWKKIPLFTAEQKRASGVIKSKNFKRPLAKTVTHHLGTGFFLYSGRKGFEALMRSLGQPLEFISQWLGHLSIERTWKNYVNKNVVTWKKVA